MAESKIKIDEEKANLLLKKLITDEKINQKTNKYNDVEMVKRIKKFIEEEVECY